jgi:dTDP-6-deoxy-L-talose 4-dehydrogenase (NAD+)
MGILVTGASGFIGRAFCREAVARGHRVLGLVRRADAGLPAGCASLLGSLSDMPWASVAAFRPDAALHLAWAATPGSNFASPDNETLVHQSDALFRGLAARGVRQLAGTGTFVEYAASAAPLVEDASALLPLYPYSHAKARTLERLRSFAADAGVAWSWFRVFNAFGEGEPRQRFISATMDALAAGRPAVVRTPDSIRDFIHVADVARGMMDALEHGLPGAVNIGTGTGTRVFDVATEVAVVMQADPGLVRRLDPPDHDLMPAAIADTARLRALGWSARIALRDGLARLCAARREGVAPA